MPHRLNIGSQSSNVKGKNQEEDKQQPTQPPRANASKGQGPTSLMTVVLGGGAPASAGASAPPRHTVRRCKDTILL
jgi:hypothetical protein